MAQRTWKWAALISILIILSAVVVPNLWGDAQAEPTVEIPSLDPNVKDQILQASIQITMVESEIVKTENDPQTDPTVEEETWQEVTRYTRGIGTLVSHQGQTLLISHDHWTLFSSGKAPDRVEFYDAKGVLLQSMDGDDLLPLILFHDSGTFILRAPEALVTKVPAAGKMGSYENLEPGDIVHVVHHSPGQSDQLSLLAVELTSEEAFNGVPMLSLRSLDGTSIEPGDSGGGIWMDGQLAGNLWMTKREVRQDWWRPNQPVRRSTSNSLAAGLHAELIDLVDILLKVEISPGQESGGLQ